MGATLPTTIGAVTLRPGLTVEGTVRGVDGRPIECAQLAFGQAPPHRADGCARAPSRGLAFAVTGVDGRFPRDELRPGRFWIIAALEGRRRARSRANGDPASRSSASTSTLTTRAVSISGTCEGVPRASRSRGSRPAGGEPSAIEQRWRELPIDARTGAFGRSAFVDGVTYRLRVAVVDPITGERDVSRAVEEAEVIAPADDVLLSWEQRTRVVVGRVVVRGESGDLVPVERFMVAHSAEPGPEGVDVARSPLEVGDGPKREHEGGLPELSTT